ncbi:MAG: hypothetical protein QT08_C0008G0010 [archaeon GW2011_AR17]|nr:MAG: hypothetical protein QT08_C0008G0010 [archaeon GW2011_AR17]MBS3153774.1 hypothetical protein [Candidatus Woesearchaeota archaeon]HIH15200.1 hypothetical protein [Nanoarchaeota archaeon]HIH59466.1 hypothetical protein [Nanoarchaeota archaeon]HII13864.1 hypothetical protein [Nanoarchaeota archaeon]
MQTGHKISTKTFFNYVESAGVCSLEDEQSLFTISRLLRRRFEVDHISYHPEFPNNKGNAGFLFVMRNSTLESIVTIPVLYGQTVKKYILENFSDKVYFRRDLSFTERVGKNLDDIQKQYPLF